MSDEVAADAVRDTRVGVGIGLLLGTAELSRGVSKMWHGETMLPVGHCGNDLLGGAGISPG